LKDALFVNNEGCPLDHTMLTFESQILLIKLKNLRLTDISYANILVSAT